MSGSPYRRNRILNNTGIILGIALALIFIFVRTLSESPYETIYRLDPSGIIPALWLLNLISFIWFFLIGYSTGIILDPAWYKKGRCNEKSLIYKGLVAFTICFFLSHISYSIFWDGKHLLVAILVILIAIACSAATMIIWSKINRISALIMGGYCIWLFYLFIIYSSVLFQL